MAYWREQTGKWEINLKTIGEQRLVFGTISA
jgi:hypothetical protein